MNSQRKKMVAGNWKMNGNVASLKEIEETEAEVSEETAEGSTEEKKETAEVKEETPSKQ